MIPISSIDHTRRDLIRLACAVVIFVEDDARGMSETYSRTTAGI
ncbi:hypothetical protein [Rhizobium leguminosarum]|nr:hypothetical protein [Rhizobium leguminosarum]